MTCHIDMSGRQVVSALNTPYQSQPSILTLISITCTRDLVLDLRPVDMGVAHTCVNFYALILFTCTHYTHKAQTYEHLEFTLCSLHSAYLKPDWGDIAELGREPLGNVVTMVVPLDAHTNTRNILVFPIKLKPFTSRNTISS